VNAWPDISANRLYLAGDLVWQRAGNSRAAWRGDFFTNLLYAGSHDASGRNWRRPAAIGGGRRGV